MSRDAFDGPRESIKGPPLGQLIANRLRTQILRGELSEGALIVQTQLAEHFGTSRIPVREALQLLEHDGLLVRDNANHCRVAEFDPQHLRERYHLRALLEGEAAALCAALQVEVTKLEEIQSGIDELDSRTEYVTDELSERVSDFHRFIWRNCGNDLLAEAAEQQWMMTSPLARSLMPGHAGLSADAHERLIGAIRAGDSALAREVMMSHIQEAGNAYLEFRAAMSESTALKERNA